MSVYSSGSSVRRLQRDFGDFFLTGLPEGLDVGWLGPGWADLLRRETGGRKSPVGFAVQLKGDGAAQDARFSKGPRIDHKPTGGYHLRADSVAHGCAGERLIVRGDTEHEFREFADPAIPIQMIGSHAHLHGGGAGLGVRWHGGKGERGAGPFLGEAGGDSKAGENREQEQEGRFHR